ncbi:integral membrane [Trichoderma arundinaceum]|uniref:Integral membrane n=1 Tax=Trichoderma arundinaceum TaxID=490622 RepID=A0A395NJX3_TRIAR|nr:integral membrane [Trichoderma arundinaceum]
MAMHAPIQLIGFVMMIGGMALGIKVAQFVGYLRNPVRAHVVIGFIVVCTIILFQPVLGILQHRHFKKTGGKSILAYLHRWIGRGSVLLGMINTGLGFQLAKKNVIIHKSSYVRSYVLLGILVFVWISFVIYDELNLRKSAAAVTDEGEKGATKHEQNKVDT